MKRKKLLTPITLALFIGAIAITSAFTNVYKDSYSCPSVNKKGFKDYGGKALSCNSPGEPGTCSQPACHGAGGKPAGLADNAGPGSLTLTSVPTLTGNQYIPGQLYNMTITVSQKGRTRMGFSCEILDNSGSTVTTKNNTAGTLTCSDPAHTRLVLPFGTGRECIAQDSFGGFTANSYSFNFQWTAPSTGYKYDSVHIYMCGNATNNDDLADSGDYVYAKHIILTKSLTDIANVQETALGLNIYPVPTHDRVTISFKMPTGDNMLAELYSIDGKKVRELENGQKDAGNFSQSYPINDLPKGIYILRISAGDVSETRKIIID